MKHPASTDNAKIRSKLGLPARAALLGVLFFIEKIFLTQFVDVERADAALGVGGGLRVAQHFGFRFIVALVAAVIVFVFASGKLWKSLAIWRPQGVFSARFGWPAHFALIAGLAWLGSLLFPPTPASIPFLAVVCLWLTCGAAAAFCAFAAMAPPLLWLKAAQTLGSIWLYSAAVALAAAIAIPISEEYWWSTAAATFQLVRIYIVADPAGIDCGYCNADSRHASASRVEILPLLLGARGHEPDPRLHDCVALVFSQGVPLPACLRADSRSA